jgi:hypothetical protein
MSTGPHTDQTTIPFQSACISNKIENMLQELRSVCRSLVIAARIDPQESLRSK